MVWLEMETQGLLQLASLLQDSELDKEPEETVHSSFTPASIGPPSKEEEDIPHPTGEKTKNIWNEDEVGDVIAYTDPRPTPEYEMNFSQSVHSEDVFLGMGNKNLSSASCENLVVRVKLNGTESSSQIQVDLKVGVLTVATPKYYLSLSLPNPVDDKMTHVQWDIDTDTLVLTFKLKREYDFLNF